jgi:hypothetical protein
MVVHHGHHGKDEVPSVAAMDLSYDEFCAKYMALNEPVLIKNIGMDWPMFRTWRTDVGQINYDYLKVTYGDAMVPVRRIHSIRFL